MRPAFVKSIPLENPKTEKVSHAISALRARYRGEWDKMYLREQDETLLVFFDQIRHFDFAERL